MLYDGGGDFAMFNKTLNRKIILLMIIAAILPIIVISIANTLVNTKGYTELANEQRELIENSVNNQLQNAANDLLKVSEMYASNQELVDAFAANDRESLEEISEEMYKRLAREHQFEIFELGDKSGTVYYRAHNPGEYGDDKSDMPSIQAALNGESEAGFAIGNSGLNIRSFLPIQLDGEVIGTLQTGVDDTFLQQIIDNLEGVSIHLYDVNGEPLESSNEEMVEKPDKETFEEVLTGETIVKEQGNMLHTYIPMFEPTQTEMIGFIQISQDISTINQVMDQNKRNALLMTVIALLIVFVSSTIVSKSITIPVKQAASLMNDISNGNLRKESIYYKGKDEIKTLIDSVNKMKENLRHMIRKVTNASENVRNRSEELTISANEVKEGSEQIAITMEELSSGSESQVENASNLVSFADHFTEKIEHVNQNSMDIANQSNDVLTLTEEGNKLMQGSVSQMKMIDQTMKNSITKVQELEEKSKEINKIVQVIHDVADQTNLLSLNASIEAARAGEHGTSFAVVANEIRKLAEQVGSSVLEITDIVQSIQKETNHVVDTLHDGYMEVGNGTKQIEATGQKFERINHAVHDMTSKVQSISASLREVSTNSNDMYQTLEEITAVTEEASSGIQQTTASTQQSSSAMEEITKNANELSLLSEDLSKQVTNFKL